MHIEDGSIDVHEADPVKKRDKGEEGGLEICGSSELDGGGGGGGAVGKVVDDKQDIRGKAQRGGVGGA